MKVQNNSVQDLIQRVNHGYDDLPKQLKLIAHYIAVNREQMVIVRVRELAEACGVQPSAVIRFSKHFGFSGFSELQEVFKSAYTISSVSGSYKKRLQAVIGLRPARMKSSKLAHGFIKACQEGIATLDATLDDDAFERSVSILQKARHIYVMGVRRMFPVATYLGYALMQTQKRVVIIDGLGGLYKEQVEGLSKGDVLISISMSPYGAETRYCTDLAVEREATVVAITDSAFSPISRAATVTLTVHESEEYYFRALACTMSLVQCLFIALAYRLELNLVEVDNQERFG